MAILAAFTLALCNSKKLEGGGSLSAFSLISSGVAPPSVVGAGMFMYNFDRGVLLLLSALRASCRH